MASFYEDASLVVIPSGYKTSKIYAEKPTDGSGDLTFTRASGATRVGPNGLIEKVRTNLALYSEQFDNAAWVKSGSFITANTTIAPDGTTTADTYTASQTNDIYQVKSATTNTEYTFSVYVKLGTATNLCLVANNALAWNTIGGQSFNSSNGLNTSTWTRISFTFTTPSTLPLGLVNFHIGGNAETGLTQSSGTVFIWGAQIETGVATAYIPTTTAAVSVGPVSNVPRLDYLGSSCPRLLLEPQRTNLVTYSEQFNNAAWSKYQSTITANVIASPDGSVNADKFLDSTANDGHSLYAAYTISADTTFSIFVKSAEYTRFAAENLSDGGSVIFNLSTATVVSTSANYKNAKIENYGNGWYRISATTNGVSGAKAMGWALVGNAGSLVFTGTGTSGVYVYGAQAEVGAYATSYIPTLSASVTRVADAASKTGISSLIGQSEGVWYWEGNLPQVSENGPNSSVGLINTAKNVNVNTAISFQYTSGNSTIYVSLWVGNGTFTPVVEFLVNGYIPGAYVKIAFAYKSGSTALYINGTLVASSSVSFTSSTTMSEIYYHDNTVYYAYTGQQKLAQSLLFKTRLTNAQLAELTTL